MHLLVCLYFFLSWKVLVRSVQVLIMVGNSSWLAKLPVLQPSVAHVKHYRPCRPCNAGARRPSGPRRAAWKYFLHQLKRDFTVLKVFRRSRDCHKHDRTVHGVMWTLWTLFSSVQCPAYTGNCVNWHWRTMFSFWLLMSTKGSSEALAAAGMITAVYVMIYETLFEN